MEHFDSSIKNIVSEIKKRGLPEPAFVIGRTGANIEMLENTGGFDYTAASSLPEIARKFHMKKRKITLIGGGSLEWTPKFLVDFALTNELKGSHICLHDIDEKALNLMYRLGKKIIKEAGNDFYLSSTTSLEEALEDTNYVILFISTGGLATMRHDLEIPSKYGIYQSVGDTVGPGGLSRALRNIPVVVGIAKKWNTCVRMLGSSITLTL